MSTLRTAMSVMLFAGRANRTRERSCCFVPLVSFCDAWARETDYPHYCRWGITQVLHPKICFWFTYGSGNPPNRPSRAIDGHPLVFPQTFMLAPDTAVPTTKPERWQSTMWARMLYVLARKKVCDTFFRVDGPIQIRFSVKIHVNHYIKP